MKLQPYPEYIATEYPWLGSIPSHWRRVPVSVVYRRIKRTGFSDAELLSVYRDYGVIPKSSREDNFNRPSEDLSNYQLVCKKDLVINKMKAWQGSVAISDYEGIVSPAYFVYEPLRGTTSKYNHYLLRSGRYIAAYISHS